MKIKILRGLAVFYFLPLAIVAQSNHGYSIHGHLEGLKEGEQVIMRVSNAKGLGSFTDYWGSKDTGYVKNGKFTINGVVQEGPRRYWMTFSICPKRINLYIDNNQDITLGCDTDITKIPSGSIEHYISITGSPTNHSLLCLEPVEEIYYQSIGRINNYAKKIKDSIGFDGPLLSSIYACRDEINRALYYNIFYGDRNPEDGRVPEIKTSNLYLPTVYSNFERSSHAPFWMDVYKNLDETRRNSFYGKWLKDLVVLSVGQTFPAFKLPNNEGKEISINEITSKAKYTIVHFWASHSTERKECQEELKVLYKKYHDKGLNIIGISSDVYLDDWQQVLKAEGFPWYNVVDLKGGKIVENIYRERGIRGAENTTNVLLDTKGTIVAWDVSGVELEWNLWKCFDNPNISNVAGSIQ